MDPWFPILALAGAAAGFLGGLFGIGGGSLMVPVLVFYLTALGLPTAQVGVMAVASSLVAVAILSSAAFFRHRQHQVGRATHIALMAFGGTLGAAIASQFAQYVGGQILLISFSCFEAVVGIRMIRNRNGQTQAAGPIKVLALPGVGFFSGGFSSLFGIGGGIVAVPLQHYVARVPLHAAIANSSGLIIVNAMVGVVAYAMAPIQIEAAIGWIHIQSALILGLAGALFAPLGASLAHRLPTTRLKRYFGGFLLVVSAVLFWKALQ